MSEKDFTRQRSFPLPVLVTLLLRQDLHGQSDRCSDMGGTSHRRSPLLRPQADLSDQLRQRPVPDERQRGAPVSRSIATRVAHLARLFHGRLRRSG